MNHLLGILLRLVAILLGGSGGYLANGIYFRRFADCTAHAFGTSFAGLGVPLLISLIAGGVATIIVGWREPIGTRFQKHWPILLLSTALSYLATMIHLWVALDVMDRL
jgi:hypothetical protein